MNTVCGLKSIEGMVGCRDAMHRVFQSHRVSTTNLRRVHREQFSFIIFIVNY
jgi:hypothetical protein